MSMELETSTVGGVVGKIPSRRGFRALGVDFCCGGRRSVAEACRAAAIDPATVEQALGALSAAPPAETTA